MQKFKEKFTKLIMGSMVWLPYVLMFSVVGSPVSTHANDFFNISGIGHINKPVVSLRQAKFKNLIEQQFDFSCGAAAVATILRYAYNKDLDEIEVLVGMSKVSDEALVREKGFSLLNIRHYIETLGLRGRGYEIPLEALPEVRIPTIALLDIRGYKHFVVVKRVVDEVVYIGDPALGNRAMPLSEFAQGWNGAIFAVVGNGFDRSTVLSKPEKPLTARKFLYDKAPITNSELLDFGFSNADLF